MIAVMVCLAGGGMYVVKAVLSDDSPQKKSSFTNITLMKPPPPPEVKEKPPEPEQVKQTEKKEEIFTPGPQDMANQDNSPGEKDNTPAGDTLGVDAEGTAGSDAFGLVAKKGGRSILSGGGGGGGGMGKLSLLSKFSGYTYVVESEIKKKVIKSLDEEGGIPRGKLQAIVRVSVDGKGSIVECKIIGSSGNNRMDEAIIRAVADLKISKTPPEGMPRKMDIKLTYQS